MNNKSNPKKNSHQIPELPKSCSSLPINCVGLFAFLFSLYFLRGHADLSNLNKLLIVMGAYVLPIMILELIFLKTYKRASTNYNFSVVRSINWKNTAIKLVGFYLTIGVIAGVYAMFPEYHGGFYNEFWDFLKLVLPPLLILALPYFILSALYLENDEDGYYQAGLFFLLYWKKVDAQKLRQHALGWLVKTFFLPLMYIYLIGSVNFIVNLDVEQTLARKDLMFKFFWELLYGIDLIIVTTGYICAVRILDSHIRSAEPTTTGWLWAVVCYQPFWSVVGGTYLAYNSDNFSWGNWLFQHEISYIVWAGLIILCTAIYAMASVSFGLRFSNLTNRGILTNGLYRYTKHPAYVSKSISWWLIAVPFVIHSGTTPMGALRDCILILCVNVIYYIRARTEENHLSNDPTYVEYATAMNQRSIFRWLVPIMPFLKYEPRPSKL